MILGHAIVLNREIRQIREKAGLASNPVSLQLRNLAYFAAPGSKAERLIHTIRMATSEGETPEMRAA